MSDLFPLFLAYLVFLGALVSPGPDFLIVLRQSLGHGARAGVFTAAGIAAGLIVHVGYCVAGIGLLITQSILLFNLIKWAGAAYLVYVGFHALRSQGTSIENLEHQLNVAGMSGHKAFSSGFIVNLFNPKATMFFLALFSQMIDPLTPLTEQALFGAVCIVTAFLWFSLVALVMGVPRVRRSYAAASKGIDRVFGGFFIALAAKLALARLS